MGDFEYTPMHAPSFGIRLHRYGQFRRLEAHAMQNDDNIGIGVIVREFIPCKISENSPIHAPITGSRIRDGLARHHLDNQAE